MIYTESSIPLLLTASGQATAAQQQQSPTEQLMLLLLILVVGLCLTATMVALAALLPGITGRSRAVVERSPWRAFFVGLVNYVFLSGIAAALFAPGLDILNLLGVFILGLLAAVTALGLGGLTQLTGQRLAQMRSGEMTALKQVVWGAVVLELTALLPFVGWFLALPVMLMISFGAAVLGWRSRTPSPGQTEWKTPS